MKNIHVLIKPASSLCNLRCTYCFYADISSIRDVRSYGKMKTETLKKMIENIFTDLENGDQLSLMFQGGEPTIAGLGYFQQLIAYIKEQDKKVHVNYSIQTNGTLINEKWCKFLKENNFLVGLSIDGLETFHDLNRLDPSGRGTFQRVLQTKKLFDRYEIEYNVLCVLTNQLAREPKKVFNFIKKQQIEFIQFIPCLDELDNENRESYVLTAERFHSFYKKLFSLWLEELKSGHYISIKLFDDIYNFFVKNQLTVCGINGECTVQYVIEADGSVYPCDFYVLDEYRLGYIQEQTLKELFNQPNVRKFLLSNKQQSSYCQTCKYKNHCCGGCKRMGTEMYVNSEENFCGYQAVLDLFLSKVGEIQNLSIAQ